MTSAARGPTSEPRSRAPTTRSRSTRGGADGAWLLRPVPERARSSCGASGRGRPLDLARADARNPSLANAQPSIGGSGTTRAGRRRAVPRGERAEAWALISTEASYAPACPASSRCRFSAGDSSRAATILRPSRSGVRTHPREARFDEVIVDSWRGVGTYKPGNMAVGTVFLRDGRSFFDVHHAENV